MWNKLPQEKRKRDPVPYEDFPNPHKGGRPAGPVLGLPQKRYGKGRRAKSSEERTENAPLIVLSAPVLARCIVNAFNPHRPKGKAWVALCLTVLEHYEGPWGPSVYPSFEGFGGFEALDPEDKSAWEKHRMGQAIRAARETPEKRAARMTRVWRKQQKAAREERARSSATR
ncbi:hypothetical protein DES42_105228 [Zavarzinia compransoris]|nr:hypothetical protein DES42_105228 [Zavarzinia compransoris]